jgi:threonine dehydrogenase-like Zn-dependent dehydrogenase
MVSVMKAVGVFPARREVKLVEHEEPKISAPDEVKLRMLAVGVCGTDREICAFEYGTPPPGSDHFILGHESLGEVVEVGAAVTRLKPGDLVIATVRRRCGHESCAACRAGRPDFCVTGDYHEHGIKDMDGFMTELVVDSEPFLNLVPAELREVAVLVEPLTIAEKALIQVRLIQQRLPWGGYKQRALVLGAGPVGLLGAMALIQAGFDTYVYSGEPEPNPKADIVRDIGARYFSSHRDPIAQVAAAIGNIDLVYEATGASQFAFHVLPFLGANGIFVFTGVPGKGQDVDLDTGVIMKNLVLKNQIVLGTVNAALDAFQTAIRDLAAFHQRWPASVRALITGRYPIEAFGELVFGKPHGIKNVIALG